MPTGLDGNPDPVVTPARTRVLDRVADRVVRCRGERIVVGIDGRSGSGKSTFADELACTLERRGRSVVRATTDLFHRPREERMRLGASSADGYFLHSHQIEAITDQLLLPFRDGAVEVLVSAFDEPSDRPQHRIVAVPTSAILIFDGLFVHRSEFLPLWDLSVMLHADRRCDAAWLRYLEADLPVNPVERAAELDGRLERARWPRYRHGWQKYIGSVDPRAATMDIDNEDLEAPAITSDRTSLLPE
jgi:uridine kinase